MPEPNVFMYSAAVSACEKGQVWQQACVLLVQMVAERLPSSIVALGAAISACEKGAEWQQALILLAQIGSRRLQ